MGRAIVRDPKVFLMDEPLSNLDAKLRVQMRTEVARLQSPTWGRTMIYVTHDQTEAMTLGDRVAVMRSGLLQQVGSPEELYERPKNLFVAGFIGSPAMNFMPAEIGGGTIKLPIGEVNAHDLGGLQLPGDGRVVAGIRPENFEDAEIVQDSTKGERGIGLRGRDRPGRVARLRPLRLLPRRVGGHPVRPARRPGRRAPRRDRRGRPARGTGADRRPPRADQQSETPTDRTALGRHRETPPLRPGERRAPRQLSDCTAIAALFFGPAAGHPFAGTVGVWARSSNGSTSTSASGSPASTSSSSEPRRSIAKGGVNISPKGPIGTLRVLDDHTVAYLDMVGSGAETVGHLRENGRIVVMLCAFDGPPRILRLHGRGEVVTADDPRFEELCARADFDAPHGIEAARRAVIVVAVERIADACGYGVPLMSLEGERPHAEAWAEKKLRVGGEAAIARLHGREEQREHRRAAGLRPGGRQIARPGRLALLTPRLRRGLHRDGCGSRSATRPGRWWR